MGTLAARLRRSASTRMGELLTRAIVGVAPPAGRAVEAVLIDDIYFPLFAQSLWQRLRQTPGDVAVRYLAFALKRAHSGALAPDPVGGRIAPQLAHWRDLLISASLARLCTGSTASGQLESLQELAEIECAIRSGSADGKRLSRLLELGPTEIRLTRDRAHSRECLIGDPVRDALWPAEVLAYVADDIARYGSEGKTNHSLVYTGFVDVYGDAAPDRLRDEVRAYQELFRQRLDALPAEDRVAVENLFRRRLPVFSNDDYPVPTPGRPIQVSGVSGAVVLFGLLCVVGWLVAYASIISRGFADATYGVPLPALVANLSWEFAYGFLLDPLGDYFHTSSIFGFLVDLVIGWQAWTYGRRHFAGTLPGQHFRPFLLLCLAVAFPVTYLSFIEFNDPDGEYTGFGINLMMSIMYLVMLQRREVQDGQSMYVALGKWLGTFCAWVATALTVTTSPNQTWPAGWRQFVRGSLRNRSYPLTPLINVMYGWTFVLDAVYSLLLYRRLRQADLSPWRRF